MTDKEFYKKWVEALRSGEYKQTTKYLYCEDKDAYCALGVGCMIAGVKDPSFLDGWFSPEQVIDFVEMTDGVYLDPEYLEDLIVVKFEEFFDSIDTDFENRINELNEYVGASFDEIAQFIEDYAKHMLKLKEASLETFYNYISLYEVKRYNNKGEIS